MSDQIVALSGVGIGRGPRPGGAQQRGVHGEPGRDRHAGTARPVLVERGRIRAAVTARLLMGGVYQTAILDIHGEGAGQPGRRSRVPRIRRDQRGYQQEGRRLRRCLSDLLFPGHLPGPGTSVAAAFTGTSMRPNSAATPATAASIAEASGRSGRASAVPPSSVIRATVLSKSSALRVSKATAAPCPASGSTVAWPRLLLAPVTTATRPDNGRTDYALTHGTLIHAATEQNHPRLEPQQQPGRYFRPERASAQQAFVNPASPSRRCSPTPSRARPSCRCSSPAFRRRRSSKTAAHSQPLPTARPPRRFDPVDYCSARRRACLALVCQGRGCRLLRGQWLCMADLA